MSASTEKERTGYYVKRSIVRSFLSYYAPPAALDKMLESMRISTELHPTEEDLDWLKLVEEVRKGVGP